MTQKDSKQAPTTTHAHDEMALQHCNVFDTVAVVTGNAENIAP